MCHSYSSDTAPALVVLDAQMVISGPDGQRVVPAQFFIGPDVDIERMTVLEKNEILTTIRLPNTWADSKFYFEKVWAENLGFCFGEHCGSYKESGGTISDVRVACGGVECVPKRLDVVEAVVKGSRRDEETAKLAGQSAIRGATPLNHNHFKIPLMENLVMRAIRDARSMEIVRYSSNAWGQRVLEGVSWDLLPMFFGLALAFILGHSIYMWFKSSDTD